MKLSDAITLGALLMPQRRGSWEGCALGAAAQAAGLTYPFTEDDVRALWPWAWGEDVAWPSGRRGRRDLAAYIIMDLNDRRGKRNWTRERIAAWVATVEPAEAIEALKTKEPSIA